MIKIKNEIPEWIIDWFNKVFHTKKYIWRMSELLVDWVKVTDYKYDKNTLTLRNAPTNSISIQYFHREIEPFEWDWLVTLLDLIMSFYKKIWRIKEDWNIPENLNRLYPKLRVSDELRKSYFRLTHKTPTRQKTQTLWLVSNVWFKANDILWENNVSLANSLNLPIEWVFLTENWLMYDYYWDDNWTLRLKDDLILEDNEKIVFWHKLPTGINKIIQVKVDWVEYDYRDEAMFDINESYIFTIIRDAQGNRYLILPYEEWEKIVSIKHNPDPSFFDEDDDVVDLPYEFIDVVVLEVAYRLLQEREDERWQAFKMELWDWRRNWLLAEYQRYLKWFNRDERVKFRLADTYKFSRRY